jgi:hypothetical protein
MNGHTRRPEQGTPDAAGVALLVLIGAYVNTKIEHPRGWHWPDAAVVVALAAAAVAVKSLGKRR